MTKTVVLVNLGTPASPTAADIRVYLREFLSDRRVVDLPRIIWKPILEGFVLTMRPPRVAKAYQSVWQEGGSPLAVYTYEQAKALAQLRPDLDVRVAMTYGQPSVKSVMDSIFSSDGQPGQTREVLVMPLYPQYADSTVAAVSDVLEKWRATTTVDHSGVKLSRTYPGNEHYIEAMAHAVEKHWQQHGKPDFEAGDKLVLSYHGIPVSAVKKGDHYPKDVEITTRALRERLGLSTEAAPQTYQSKFGPAPWLTPSTIGTMEALGKAGTGRVDVICPGFLADCLETLEEIEEENQGAYREAGGGEFHYIKWANAIPTWTSALAKIVDTELQHAYPTRGDVQK